MENIYVLIEAKRGSTELELRPGFFLLTKVFLTFDSDQIETNGQRHWVSLIRLSIRIFNPGSVRSRDRKLAKYESYDDVI